MELEEFLKNKTIVILGFGKQGKATFKFLRKHFPNKKIAISDKSETIDKSELDENVEYNLGEKYLENIEKYDLIIKSPGVVLKDVDTSSFENKIITDYELLLRFTKGLKIGITGTKGKSTTSTFLYDVLKNQGKKAYLVGNIGTPILDKIEEIEKAESEAITVIEVSSHTLEFVKYSPNIAILLDIYPEHLDHCNSLDDYIRAKFNIAKFQKNDDIFIYNAENELMKKWKFNYKENDIGVYFKGNNLKNPKNKVYIKENGIYFNDKFLMSKNEELSVKGNHMLNNMMFILAVSEILKLDINKTIKTLKTAKPLEHRMQYVGEFEKIKYYDNSIATIPIATIDAIETLKDVNTLICGGMDRGVSQEELIKFLEKSNVEHIICMPETGNIIYDKLINKKDVYKVKTMEEAVKIAKDKTKKGSICLLSPAASSYNDFKNFEEKGNLFQKLAKEEK